MLDSLTVPASERFSLVRSLCSTTCRLWFKALAIVAALAVAPASAQEWTGAGIDTNVNNPANWADGVLPPLDTGTSTLTFATGTSTLATLDTPLDIARLILNASPLYSLLTLLTANPAFTIDGPESLTLQGFPSGTSRIGLVAGPWSDMPNVSYRIAAGCSDGHEHSSPAAPAAPF